jgi:hypothetical protein
MWQVGWFPPGGRNHMQLSRTDMYRMKGIACEHRASDASDPTSKQDWAELAIEWHAMAYREDYTDEPQRC